MGMNLIYVGLDVDTKNYVKIEAEARDKVHKITGGAGYETYD